MDHICRPNVACTSCKQRHRCTQHKMYTVKCATCRQTRRNKTECRSKQCAVCRHRAYRQRLWAKYPTRATLAAARVTLNAKNIEFMAQQMAMLADHRLERMICKQRIEESLRQWYAYQRRFASVELMWAEQTVGGSIIPGQA